MSDARCVMNLPATMVKSVGCKYAMKFVYEKLISIAFDT